MADREIFGDWSDVKDCNDCEHYYLSQCDGTQKGEKRTCKEFLVTRRGNLYKEIEEAEKRLQEQLNVQSKAVTLLCIVMIVICAVMILR